MPFCTQPEAFVQIWNLYQAGEETAAQDLFDRTILPVNRISAQGAGLFYQVHKEILRQRGVIQTAKVREPAPAMDAFTRRELQAVIERLYG
jgi:4-hydroxy-tetrahydrodipicolinate synthase